MSEGNLLGDENTLKDLPVDVILAKARELSAHPDRIHGPDTEVYYDAGLWGEDAWELIDFVFDKYGVDFSAMDTGRYVPHEGFDLREILVWIGKRPFKSLTISSLARAVDEGAWHKDW